MKARFARRLWFWVLAGWLLTSTPAYAIDLWDGRINIHGSYEMQVRMLNPDFQHEWDLAQWRHILALESDISLLEEPVGILDSVSAFVRVELSYDCMWERACRLFPSADAYGDRAHKYPGHYRTGHESGLVGNDPAVSGVNPRTPYHKSPALSATGGPRNGTDELITLHDLPPFRTLGTNVAFNQAFKPVLRHRFAVRQNTWNSSNGDSTGIDATQMPVRPKDRIDNRGTLRWISNASVPTLPMRPAPAPFAFGPDAMGLYNPSRPLRDLMKDDDIDRFDQNFSETQLAFNHGASQDEYELKEAYFDIEMFDTRFFLRVGKQTIVWGKTELFRNQDQINPSDVALTTLPNLEESRIPQWAIRGIWSFYEVGPFEDVRLEFAWLFDDFEPNDVGRCGEPFSPMVVCNKTFGLFEYGLFGLGLAGEIRPPNWWEDVRGNEVGVRLEFRWKRFSFAVTDFWHFEDFATPRIFQSFNRNVDPKTGRPRKVDSNGDCTDGTQVACLRPSNALDLSPMNRQVYDAICKSSEAFFDLDPTVCALSITNSTATPLAGAQLAEVVSLVLSGGRNAVNTSSAAIVVGLLVGAGPTGDFVLMNADDCDDFLDDCTTGQFTPPAVFNVDHLNEVLTDQQEALVGCGAYYFSNCNSDGADLFNAEASVVFQTWPGNLSEVATRRLNGRSIVLPGARSPFDVDPSDPRRFRYDPRVDGCVAPLGDLLAMGLISMAQFNAIPARGQCDDADTLTNPVSGEIFENELAALSYNALLFVVALDLSSDDGPPPGCALPTAADPNAPLNCPTVQDFFSVTAMTRKERRAGGDGTVGRRDFAWAGAAGAILEYHKVNTFGFAMDFSEDFTLTNWGIEFTWTHNKPFTNSEQPDLVSKTDHLALTISMDRPTFINFLNANRTFFFNMQWFFEYIPDYAGSKKATRHEGFVNEGPFTALGVFTFFTGLYQDRLTPRATFVYDVNSRSGAVIYSFDYRFSSNASVQFGMNHFYGSGRGWQIPYGFGAAGESRLTNVTERFPRLNVVRERDELFLKLRYTF